MQYGCSPTRAARSWRAVVVAAALTLAVATAAGLAACDGAAALAANGDAEEAAARIRPSADVTASMTLIADRPFNSKSNGGAVEGWTNEEAAYANFSIVTDATAPRSPSNVAQAKFPAGFSGNNSPTRAKINFSLSARTVKSSQWVWLSPNWQGGNGSNASTIVSLNVGSSKRVSFQVVGTTGTLTPRVALFGDGDSRDYLTPNVVPSASVPRGTWVKWTTYVRASQKGAADGGVNLYLDDVLVLSYNDVKIIPAKKTDYFDQFDWKPNWGQSGDAVSAEQYMRWDHATTHATTARLADDPTPPPADTSVASVTLTPEYDSVLVGATKQFTAAAKDANGVVRAYAITWSSTAPQIATVDNAGLATGVASGVATVVAAAGGKADSSTLTVYQNAPPPPDTAVASVTVAPVAASIVDGTTQQFTATVRNAADSALTRTVTWTSDATSVATVNSSGLATGVDPGTARIIATVGAKADSADLTVTPVPSSNAHWVAVGGVASGSGTFAAPWGLQYALSGAGGQVTAGDTVFVRAGTYDTTAVVGWRLTVNGSSSARIVFSGAPGESAPVIKKQFRVTGDYVNVQRMKFHGPIDGTTNQVWLTTVHDVLFTENEIAYGNANAGLSVDNAANLVISHNYIHHNGNTGTNTDHGIYFKTTDGTGNLITNNVITHNAARGISLHDNNYPSTGVYDVVVSHNTIVANGSTGLLLNDGDRNTVVNNILAGNGDATNQAQLRVQQGSAQVVKNNVTWHATATSRRGIDNSGNSTSVMGTNAIADPLFVTYPSDLNLTSSSPAIGYGDATFAQALDYLFRTRSSPVDAGAYEYVP